MAIIIESRSRATVNDPWSAWSNLPVDTVTDGTFTNTDLVEYRTQVDLLFSDITSNVTTSTDGNYSVTGDGIFDNLMEALNTHIDAQYKLDRLKGTDYANVYLAGVQTAMQQAVQFVLQEKVLEKDIELKQAQIDATSADKINNGIKVLEEAVAQFGYESATLDSTTGVVTLGTRSATEGVINKQEAQLDKQILDLAASTTLKTSQNAEVLADTIRKDAESAKNVLLLQEKIDTEVLQNTPTTGLMERQVKIQEDQLKLSKIPSGRG